jgi:hypothetical protein
MYPSLGIAPCVLYTCGPLAWPLVDGALLVIAKRGAQPQTFDKLLGARVFCIVYFGFEAGSPANLHMAQHSCYCKFVYLSMSLLKVSDMD